MMKNHPPHAAITTLHIFVRYFLTAAYFGILVPMFNEALLCVNAWINTGGLPNLTDLVSTAFFIIWAPLAFATPALLTGLVFATLLSLFRPKTIACLCVPVLCALFTGYYLGGYTYVQGNTTYHLSSQMQLLSTINAGVISFILAILASTVYKNIFVPVHFVKANKNQQARQTTLQRKEPQELIGLLPSRSA